MTGGKASSQAMSFSSAARREQKRDNKRAQRERERRAKSTLEGEISDLEVQIQKLTLSWSATELERTVHGFFDADRGEGSTLGLSLHGPMHGASQLSDCSCPCPHGTLWATKWTDGHVSEAPSAVSSSLIGTSWQAAGVLATAHSEAGDTLTDTRLAFIPQESTGDRARRLNRELRRKRTIEEKEELLSLEVARDVLRCKLVLQKEWDETITTILSALGRCAYIGLAVGKEEVDRLPWGAERVSPRNLNMSEGGGEWRGIGIFHA